MGLFEVSERFDEAHDDAYRHKTHSLTHQGPTSHHLWESRRLPCLVKFSMWTDTCKRCLHKTNFPPNKSPRYFKGEKGNELLTCNRRLWRKLRNLGASRVPCHVSPFKAIKKKTKTPTYKTFMAARWWGSLCAPGPLVSGLVSSSSKSSWPRRTDPNSLSTVAIYLAEWLSVSSIDLNICLNISLSLSIYLFISNYFFIQVKGSLQVEDHQ